MHQIATHLLTALLAGALFTACATDSPRRADAPAPARDAPSEVVFTDGHATGVINQIHPPYGNIDTVFTAGDLNRLGIDPGDRFEVEAHGNTLEVLWATTYEDVPEGEGVAFLNWEIRLRIARNHANAAESLGVSEGETVTIRALPGSGD